MPVPLLQDRRRHHRRRLRGRPRKRRPAPRGHLPGRQARRHGPPGGPTFHPPLAPGGAHAHEPPAAGSGPPQSASCARRAASVPAGACSPPAVGGGVGGGWRRRLWRRRPPTARASEHHLHQRSRRAAELAAPNRRASAVYRQHSHRWRPSGFVRIPRPTAPDCASCRRPPGAPWAPGAKRERSRLLVRRSRRHAEEGDACGTHKGCGTRRLRCRRSGSTVDAASSPHGSGLRSQGCPRRRLMRSTTSCRRLVSAYVRTRRGAIAQQETPPAPSARHWPWQSGDAGFACQTCARACACAIRGARVKECFLRWCGGRCGGGAWHYPGPPLRLCHSWNHFRAWALRHSPGAAALLRTASAASDSEVPVPHGRAGRCHRPSGKRGAAQQ